jgi:hypothetical protein
MRLKICFGDIAVDRTLPIGFLDAGGTFLRIALFVELRTVVVRICSYAARIRAYGLVVLTVKTSRWCSSHSNLRTQAKNSH